MTTTIRALGVDDAASYIVLRRSALLLEPHAFASSPEDDPGCLLEGAQGRLAPEQIDAGTVTFGAFVSVDLGAWATELVGITTLHREPQRKLRHKAWIFAVFVAPQFRKQRLGLGLMTHAIEHARGLEGLESLQLGVAAVNKPAFALYEQLGFVRYGCEPRAIKVDESYYDEILMQLSLRD